MAASHLVVSRSGASTVAELAAVGRPAILVPLPYALDQDQFANAGVLSQAGGALLGERLLKVQAGVERRRRVARPATTQGCRRAGFN